MLAQPVPCQGSALSPWASLPVNHPQPKDAALHPWVPHPAQPSIALALKINFQPFPLHSPHLLQLSVTLGMLMGMHVRSASHCSGSLRCCYCSKAIKRFLHSEHRGRGLPAPVCGHPLKQMLREQVASGM